MSAQPSLKRPVRRNADLTAATTRRLLDVAREAFTRKGYAATNIDEIVTEAGVTRGALYHHFTDKKALFEAVVLEIQSEIGKRIEEIDRGEADLWTGLLLGCREFLLACTQPAVRQIVMLDGPSALGPELWRQADETHSTHLLRARLRLLIEQEVLVHVDPDILTALLNGALNDVALLIANSENPDKVFNEAWAVFETLISGLQRTAAVSSLDKLSAT